MTFGQLPNYYNGGSLRKYLTVDIAITNGHTVINLK